MPETPDIPEELPLVDEAVVGEASAPLPDNEAALSQEICGGTPTSQNRDVGHPASAPEGEAVGSAEVYGDTPTSQKRDMGHPTAAEEEDAGIAKENDPMRDVEMLDVHVPHAKHTWKDFIIHIGTITVGLLIAIGLDQGVEKLDRLHQRHELETRLHDECADNKQIAEVDLAVLADDLRWRLGLHQDIQTMLATGGKANLPYRVLQRHTQHAGDWSYTGGTINLGTTVWDTAAEDNRLTLLLYDRAELYFRLYRIQATGFTGARESAIAAGDRQSAFESRFADLRTPGTPVLARMNAAQLDEYDALVMEAFAAFRREKSALVTFYGTDNAVIDGTLDLAREQQAAKAAYPDDFDKMAQEIERENVERDKAAGKPAEKGVR